MKHIYKILIIPVMILLGVTTAFAQENQHAASDMRVAEEQRRLHQADSLYKLRSSSSNETKRILKDAERELKEAQQKYKQAKIAHNENTKQAKQAKQSYKMEGKAIKARKKADKQAAKAFQ